MSIKIWTCLITKPTRTRAGDFATANKTTGYKSGFKTQSALQRPRSRLSKTKQRGATSKSLYQKHHMPANAVSPLSRDKGGAIQISPADHKLTGSYGPSKAAKAYRAKQKAHIDAGDFKSAFEMDVRDIRLNFGNKYDGATQQARQYYINEGMFK